MAKRGWLVPLWAAMALSCGPSPAQLVVVVETNLAIPEELDSLELVVAGPSGERRSAIESVDDPALFPFTLGVYPAGASLGPVEVVAIGSLDGVEQLRTSARVTLAPSTTQVLHLVLVRGCIGRVCESGGTCRPGGCGSVDVADLSTWEGVLPTYVEDGPCDAAPWDVDEDGDGASVCGGTDCDDLEPSVGLGFPELCDTLDNDCDGTVDRADCECAPDGATGECELSCGVSGVRECSGGVFGACEALPESCDGLDNDCDGMVDEGHVYDELAAPLRLTEDSSNSARPDLIWADDRWAVAWQDHLPTASDPDEEWAMWLSILAAEGEPILGPVRAAASGYSASLGWSGAVLGLAFVRAATRSICCTAQCLSMCETTDHRLQATTLALAGEPLSEQVRLANDVDTLPEVRTAWDGARFVVGHGDGVPSLRWLEENGAHGGSASRAPRGASRSDFLFNGSEAVFLCTRNRSVGNDGEVYLQRLSAEESWSVDAIVAANFAERPAFAWTGDGYVATWLRREDGRTSGNREWLDVVATDALGVPYSDASTLSSSVGYRDGGMVGTPVVEAASGQTFIVWEDARDEDIELYFARVSPTGQVIQTATRLTVAEGASRDASLAWSGESMGVAWIDERDGNPELYFSRLGCPAP